MHVESSKEPSTNKPYGISDILRESMSSVNGSSDISRMSVCTRVGVRSFLFIFRTFGTAIVFCRFVCHFFIFLRCELDRNLRVDLHETCLGSRVLRGFTRLYARDGRGRTGKLNPSPRETDNSHRRKWRECFKSSFARRCTFRVHFGRAENGTAETRPVNTCCRLVGNYSADSVRPDEWRC